MMPWNKIQALFFFADAARQWEDGYSGGNWLDGIATRSKLSHRWIVSLKLLGTKSLV